MDSEEHGKRMKTKGLALLGLSWKAAIFTLMRFAQSAFKRACVYKRNVTKVHKSGSDGVFATRGTR